MDEYLRLEALKEFLAHENCTEDLAILMFKIACDPNGDVAKSFEKIATRFEAYTEAYERTITALKKQNFECSNDLNCPVYH